MSEETHVLPPPEQGSWQSQIDAMQYETLYKHCRIMSLVSALRTEMTSVLQNYTSQQVEAVYEGLLPAMEQCGRSAMQSPGLSFEELLELHRPQITLTGLPLWPTSKTAEEYVHSISLPVGLCLSMQVLGRTLGAENPQLWDHFQRLMREEVIPFRVVYPAANNK